MYEDELHSTYQTKRKKKRLAHKVIYPKDKYTHGFTNRVQANKRHNENCHLKTIFYSIEAAFFVIFHFLLLFWKRIIRSYGFICYFWYYSNNIKVKAVCMLYSSSWFTRMKAYTLFLPWKKNEDNDKADSVSMFPTFFSFANV